MPSTKFVFFKPIGKTRWPPWPLIGWDIFDFSVETAERNSTKLNRNQDLNALHQVCVFRADRKNKIAALASDWLRHFRLLLWNRWTEFNENLTESKISEPFTKFVFFGPIRKTRWPPWPLIGWDILDFSSETAERNSTKLDRKQDLRALYQVCVFRADQKNKMAALASDWLRHFGLFLKHCTLTNKAVGTIWRALSKPPQRRQGPDLRPLWLLVGTPSAIRPELAFSRAEHSLPYSDVTIYIFAILYLSSMPYV